LPIVVALLFLYVNSGSSCANASSFPQAPHLTNDALVPPDVNVRKAMPAQSTSVKPGYEETSEYLIGSVAVGIVFLESNGTIDYSTEYWASLEESSVINEIQAGLSWWANQNPSAQVSFKYDIHYRVPTRYEPINRPSTSEGLWIKDAMAYLGFTGTYYFTQIRDYVNSIRKMLETDWAFTIFVVDSSNDADGMFPDDMFAYAYLGGPFLVMTYDNDGWGIDRMDIVTAHETGHMFYATDEYDGITEYSGYLDVPDVSGSGCLMDGSDIWPPSLSSGTRGQIGWRDSDDDGIQDIVDTFPNTTLFAYSPDPTRTTDLTYGGLVVEVPYPNKNPQPGRTHRDVTINEIVIVQYRVDSGPWLNASATNGAFNASEENFTFTTQPLSSNTHFLETRGINTVGNTETSFASDTVTVKTVPPVTSLGYSSPHYVRPDSTVSLSKNTYISLSTLDDGAGITSTYYGLESGNWTQYTIPFTLPGIPDGLHTLYFYSVDEVGNEETIKSFGFIMDNTGPIVSLDSPTNGSVLAAPTVNVSWMATDDGSDIAVYGISIDAGNYIDVGLSTIYVFQALVEGNHEISIMSADNLGNSNETMVSFSVDESPPTVSITSPASSTLSNISNVTAVWTGLDATSGIERYEVKLDESAWLNVGMETTYTMLGIFDGQHNLTVKAADKAGNLNETSVNFVVDTTPPVISMVAPLNVSQLKSSNIMVNWIGSDETSGIGNYRIRLDENSWIIMETNTSCTFNQVGDGSHIIYVEAIDRADNSQQTQIEFIINTSLIGEPGWTDDAYAFGTISGCILIVLGLFLIRRRRKSRQADSSVHSDILTFGEISLLFGLSFCGRCLLQNSFSHEFQLFRRKAVAVII